MSEATNMERIPLMWRKSLARVTSFGVRPPKIVVPTQSRGLERHMTTTPSWGGHSRLRQPQPERDKLEIVRMAFDSRFQREWAIMSREEERQWKCLKRFYQAASNKQHSMKMRKVNFVDDGMVDGIAIERRDFRERTGKPATGLRLPPDRPHGGDCPRVFYWG